MIPAGLGGEEQLAADQFRTFYAALVALRDAIAPPAGTVASAPPPPIDVVRTRLVQAIGDLGYRHDNVVGEAPVDSGYVLAALADDMILDTCETWADYQAWADRPLEAVLYGSRVAGDRVFAAGEDLVAPRRTDGRTATTILMALLMGFRGRYLGSEDGGRIAALQGRLYALVCRRDYRPDDAAPYLAPDLAGSALAGPSVRPLPALWQWIAALVLLIAAYLPASHLLWASQVAPIDNLADRIVAADDDPAANTSAAPPPR